MIDQQRDHELQPPACKSFVLPSSADALARPGRRLRRPGAHPSLSRRADPTPTRRADLPARETREGTRAACRRTLPCTCGLQCARRSSINGATFALALALTDLGAARCSNPGGGRRRRASASLTDVCMRETCAAAGHGIDAHSLDSDNPPGRFGWDRPPRNPLDGDDLPSCDCERGRTHACGSAVWAPSRRLSRLFDARHSRRRAVSHASLP